MNKVLINKKTYAKAVPSVSLIICLCGLPQISETIYAPALPDITASLNTNSHLVQWSLSIYFIGFAFGVAIWGKLSDHIGRKPVILIGLSLYVLMSLLCGISTNITHLLIARLFQAIGISVGSVITQAIMRDCFSGVDRDKIFSIVGMALALAPAIGPLLGGYLTQNFSWTANFICLTIMGLGLFLYALLDLPETVQNNHINNNYTLLLLAKKMLSDKHIFASSVLVGGFNGILFSYYSESPYIFIELFKLNPSHYGILGIFMATGVCFGSFISHRINHKVSTDKLIKISCYTNLAVMMFFSILVVSQIINAESVLSIILIMIFMMLFYVSFGIGIPNILSKALISYQDNIGAASSIFGLLYYCWVSIFIFGIGSFLPNSLYVMPLYFLAISFLMIVCSKFLIAERVLL
ncbi:MAG: multidrug effflux MFS transporter [Rickettsia endosymbiont of Pseudomimeciton antennatum]|nr:multidrug effflux MFS transporter [Rickettsia endosymbiont of Pseudomimeciton antennatum]